MRTQIRPLQFLLAAATAIAVLGGCKPQEGTPDTSENLSRDPSGILIPVPLGNRNTPAAKKIALCLPDSADPHQRVQINLLAGMLRNTDDCELVLSDAKGNAATQNEQLHALVATKPMAVLLLPVDAAESLDEIAALRQGGATVIGLDASLNDGSCDSVVFCDQKKIGAAAGNLIVSALKRKARDSGTAEVTGRVVQIQGDENHPSCRARNEGFLSALKTQPGIILVHDAPTKWDKANAVLRLQEALRLQKNFDAVYAHNDMLALAVSEEAAKQNIRENLLIVGTDGIIGPGAGLEMLRKTQIDATVHNPLLVDFAWRIVEKMSEDKAFKPKATYEIEPIIFTPANMEELKSKGLQVPPL